MSEQIDYRGYAINISRDEDAESPREWDNLGTMTCFHRKYNLGDKHDMKSTDFNSWSELRKKIERGGAAVILPLFLMDHSGITMRTSSETFRACDQQAWDWGMVGFIYITHAKIRSEYGWKRLTKQRRAKLAEYLDDEVKTYDQYLTGDVYYYSIDDDEGNSVDSCGGCFGYEYVVQQAKEAVDNLGALLPA